MKKWTQNINGSGLVLWKVFKGGFLKVLMVYKSNDQYIYHDYTGNSDEDEES